MELISNKTVDTSGVSNLNEVGNIGLRGRLGSR